MALLGGVMVAAFSRVDALVQGQDLFVQAAPCMRPTIRGAAMSSCKLLFQKHSYLAVFPYLISIGCLRHPMPWDLCCQVPYPDIAQRTRQQLNSTLFMS